MLRAVWARSTPLTWIVVCAAIALVVLAYQSKAEPFDLPDFIRATAQPGQYGDSSVPDFIRATAKPWQYGDSSVPDFIRATAKPWQIIDPNVPDFIRATAKPTRKWLGPVAACAPQDAWRPAANAQERQLLQVLRARATAFAQHLEANYPDDRRTRRLFRQWNGTVHMSSKDKGTEEDTGASFSSRGCLVMNPYFERARAGRAKMLAGINTPGTLPGMDDFGRLLARLLHEMAHSSGRGHDAEFYDAQRFFLKIASEEMKWPLVVNCRVCCHSTAPCREACPKCTWMEPPNESCKTSGKCNIK